MSKFFEIEGYWKADKVEFSGIVKEYDDYLEEEDDDIFYYGMGESDLKDAINSGDDTCLDFVVINYKETIYP
jgi:succinate dehydrogenase flavin-adding protein (antitoxin of CptAB toxin-antitoxin module)